MNDSSLADHAHSHGSKQRLPQTPQSGHASHGGAAALALGALGIVYGDIGTSPLYAFREALEGHHLEPNRTTVYGAGWVRRKFSSIG